MAPLKQQNRDVFLLTISRDGLRNAEATRTGKRAKKEIRHKVDQLD